MAIFIAGNYIYHKTATDDFTEAIIRTPWFKNDNSYCIKFSFHMYGNSNKIYGNPRPCDFMSNYLEERGYGGALRVYAYEKRKNEDLGKHRFIFGKQRSQGNMWHTYSTSYSQDSDVEVSYLLQSFLHVMLYGPILL